MSFLYSNPSRVSHHCKDSGAQRKTQRFKSEGWQLWPWQSWSRLSENSVQSLWTVSVSREGLQKPSGAHRPQVLKEDLIISCKKYKSWQLWPCRCSREGSTVSLTATLSSAKCEKPPLWLQPHTLIIHLPQCFTESALGVSPALRAQKGKIGGETQKDKPKKSDFPNLLPASLWFTMNDQYRWIPSTFGFAHGD